MTTIFHSRILMTGILFLLCSASSLNAQLDKVFERVFDQILGENGELVRVTDTLPNGMIIDHGLHFQPAADSANNILVPALNRLIASNVSSFPLSSTSAGIRFDFSTGQPVRITESLGPIFAETGKTLGKGRVNVGVNYSYLNLARFRGVRTNDIRFTFVHQDVGPPGLGGISTESDIMDIYLDLDINANIFAFFATVGITRNFDINVALPVLNVSLKGTAKAVVRSFTHAHNGSADHHFGVLGQEVNEPDLDTEVPYGDEGSAFGIGDLAVRMKYAFLSGSAGDFAALLDARLPTGRKEDFLGTGSPNIRFSAIASKKIGDFTPHLNAGYEYRGADYDDDEFEFIAGFDQKLVRGLTLAVDVLGEIDLNTDEDLTFEYNKDPIFITDQVANSDGIMGTLTREIDQTNIPSRIEDNVFNAAIGFRYAPVDNTILLANMLLPLNDGGLRSDIAYTVGFTITF